MEDRAPGSGAPQATSDPARDLKGLLRKPQTKHFSPIVKPERLAELLRACDGYMGTTVVRTALRPAPMLLRPGELRHAAWAEIDLDAAEWTMTAVRMKRERAGKLHGAPHLARIFREALGAALAK